MKGFVSIFWRKFNPVFTNNCLFKISIAVFVLKEKPFSLYLNSPILKPDFEEWGAHLKA